MPDRIDSDPDPISVLRGSGETALDAAVPLRTGPRTLGERLDDRAALVLNHADGVSSIAEISSQTKIPISDTIATVLELVWKGFVELPNEAKQN